ncbi:hypothetical protein FKN01_28200 [Streptomyces sp. 130]|uniref:hypothetical protein n=1 Tax=Streptomyces sp. 130 TaxID=2591006 RepID=UPI00117CE5BA|nr:hypothetical protein [Streptomyces sp. 130]TRV73108.1 hypothetical protein FKN01_28200 [Streptomyces sp. 130]
MDYAFWTASLVVLVVGIFLLGLDHGLTREQILSNLGQNLIASVIFAVIFSWLSGRVQERSLQDSLEESFGDHAHKLASAVAQGNKEFLPDAVYPPLDPKNGEYGHRFNTDMTRSLEKTGFYAFRGPSARYVAARLRESTHYPQQVKVAMLSPGDPRAIQRRAADRVPWERFQGMDVQDLESKLRQELIITVVSLFDYRRYCPVNLLYVEDTAVHRYEIFDDSVYVAWYGSPRSRSMEMPESLRFPAGSFLYKTLRLDLLRRFDISSDKSVTFLPEQDDNFLAQHLAGVLGRTVTQADIDGWRREYDSEVEEFSDYLKSMYRDMRRIS